MTTLPAPIGRALARTYDGLARLPMTVLAVLVALQTAFLLHSRSLWYSDEVRYADAYRGVVQAGRWLVLQLNGQPYPDKPPVYFWFIALMDKLVPAGGDAHFFVAAAVSGLLFVWAGYALARGCGLGRGTGLGAGLVLLSTLFVVAVLHYSRMDLLFAACIVTSWACLARDARSPEPTRWPTAALALAGLATLIKGPLGLVFPILAAAIFWLWRGQPRRLATRAMGLGWLACLALLLAWLIGAWAREGGEFLRVVFVQQIFERATNTFHHKEGPWYYFLALPAAFLPWTAALGGLPWRRFARLGGVASRTRRDPAAAGRAFLWIAWVSAFGLLSLLSGKVFIYVLPLLAPLA
ncbi:MAG: ArnT family glycosyltransferase, partial [Desulfovibrionaceae bacterium]